MKSAYLGVSVLSEAKILTHDMRRLMSFNLRDQILRNFPTIVIL